MEIKAFQVTQNNKLVMYVCVMAAREVISRARIDSWNLTNSSGYQRELDSSRFDWHTGSLLKYMIKGMGVFPNSIVVNVREPLSFTVERPPSLENCGLGTLDLGESVFWLVDGQHRLNIVKELWDANPVYYGYPFIVTILNTPEPYMELLTFYFIHKRQQTITSSMKDKLLIAVLEHKGHSELVELEGVYGLKRTYAFDLVSRLNSNEDSVFFGKIGYSLRNSKEDVVIEHSKMINTVMPLVNNIHFRGLAAQDIVENLKRYWDGIYQIYPEIFEAPHEYVLLSEKGITLFHKLYISVFRDISKSGVVSEKKVEELFERFFEETPSHSVEDFRGRLKDHFWHKKYGPEIIRKMSSRNIKRIHQYLMEKLYVDNKEKLVLLNI